MILELQKSKFLNERLNGDTAHGRPGSDITQNESLHPRLLPVLLPPLLQVSE